MVEKIQKENTKVQNKLTKEEAERRSAVVRGVEYNIALSFQSGASSYQGDVTVHFEYDTPSVGIELDFTGTEISRLEVNEQTVASEAWSSNRIALPSNLLREQNIVRIVYRNQYDHTGVGLHQFVDPKDKEEYLYSQCEPYEAHRIFPCFDQPDIKAIYRTRIAAPGEWKVITNSPEIARGIIDDGRIAREFEKSPLFSPYLFAIVAGSFQSFESEHNDIPLAIYCRKSLAKHMDPEEFFKVTKQGLDFFSMFFDYPYPFAKYDQLFCPEFNFGAMENVGAVTFSERMIFRDPPTNLQRLNRAEVILHEMAHMWFGNLVTMRWWNDLWLNESFATYMSYLAIEQATDFSEGAWLAFNSRMKAWAYAQDQLITTHPIAGEVPDTDATFLNFDGITYGKGAAVLKQLVATIGQENFQTGMQHYFKTYAWGNTTLIDFLGALEHVTQRNLKEWSKLWLETESLNTIKVLVNSENNIVSRIDIEQTAPEDHPVLRPHRVHIALFDETQDGSPCFRESIPVDIDGPNTEIGQFSNIKKPAAIFPNYDDHGFTKLTLDDTTLDFVRTRLGRFDEPLLRLQLWQTLWEMVRDQNLRASEYIGLVIDSLATETNQELVSTVINNALTAVDRYVSEKTRLKYANNIFHFARRELFNAENENFRITWARALITAAKDSNHVSDLIQLAEKKDGINGFKFDQDMRWSIIVKAHAYDLPNASLLLTTELEVDGSDRGQRAAETARTSRPVNDIKAAAWDRFHTDNESSLHIIRAAMQGFFWVHQESIVTKYVDRYFEQVRIIFETRDKDFASAYFHSLYPSHSPSTDVVKKTQSLISTLRPDETLLYRSLREAQDELERTIACRQYDEN